METDVSVEGRKQWTRCVMFRVTVQVRVWNVELNVVWEGMSWKEKFGAWSQGKGGK